MTTHTWATTGTVSGLANNQQGNVIAENLAKMVPSGTEPTAASTGLTSIEGLWWHDTANDQIKVRDQADTTWITIGTIDETGKTFTPVSSSVAAIRGAASKLKVDTTSGSVAVTADEIVVETSSNAYEVLRSVSVTISTATSGANGLDTGTVAANTWYSVWVIYNSTTVAGLLSTSATAPTLPGGYTYSARVGWVRTNATPALYPTLQFGRRARYVVDGSVLTASRVLQSGSTGSPSTPTWTAKAVSTFVPSTANAIDLLLHSSSATNNDAAVAPNSNYGAYDSASNPPPMVLNEGPTGIQHLMALESTNVYVATSANNGVFVIGWEDNL